MQKMTREEIQKRFHSSGQPEIMNKMFDEVIDFAIDNYDFQTDAKIYVVMGQSQISNFVMQVFQNKPDAEKFIADEKNDKTLYIEEHELH